MRIFGYPKHTPYSYVHRLDPTLGFPDQILNKYADSPKLVPARESNPTSFQSSIRRPKYGGSSQHLIITIFSILINTEISCFSLDIPKHLKSIMFR